MSPEQGAADPQVDHRAGAVRAWSRYLAIRFAPDPALRPEVDRVKAELGRLVGEPR